MSDLAFRPMTRDDVDRVPIGCQGTRNEVCARIDDLGTSAILAFDGAQHVAQLQLRRFAPGLRSPNGLFDPRYWGDFAEHVPDVPENALSVFCFHVGQLEDDDKRDARYQGRGVGVALLDHALAWADDAGFEAVVAKATPSVRTVMGFMGGQPAGVYETRGFETTASWTDAELARVVSERDLAPDADPEDVARVSCCVRGRIGA